MHKSFIIGLIFNVPLHKQTAFLGPLSTWGATLSGPVALLGFTCWNTHRTSSLFVLSLWKSSFSADALFKISWICLCFCEKSWQSKQLKNWFSSLTSPAVFTEAIFCVLPFTHLLINFIPLHTLLILSYVKWLSILFLYCSFSLWISSFRSFCTDLCSSLSFFRNIIPPMSRDDAPTYQVWLQKAERFRKYLLDKIRQTGMVIPVYTHPSPQNFVMPP